jgi:ferredoxin-type protein NapF
MMSNNRLLRLAVQLASFGAATILLWSRSWSSGARSLAQASPFVAICSSIARRAVAPGAFVGFALALMSIFRRRWFCRYLCPVGLLLEGASSAGVRKTSWWSGWKPLGHYAALLTLFSALFGYPILVGMDPLAIFSSAFAGITAGRLFSGVLLSSGLGILVIMSLTSGNLWCVRLCALGGTQELLSSVKTLFTENGNASSAQDSASFTPMTGGMARRAFVLGAAGIGLALWCRRIGVARSRTDNAPLRPPGAADEDVFAGLCMRCGNCVRVCPSKIIHSDTGQAGIAGLLAPLVVYDKDYCREDCARCTQVCPSGALRSLNLKQKTAYVIGEALLDASACLLATGKRDCDACARACPFDAVRIHWDDEQYIAYPLVDYRRCNGCGACEVACPVEGTKAIRIWKARINS